MRILYIPMPTLQVTHYLCGIYTPEVINNSGRLKDF